MKEYLIKIFNEYQHKVVELNSWLQDTSVDQRWGMGAMPAYSIEPYCCELQEYSSGKMLKAKQSSLAVNKQNYFLDENNQIIGELRYAKFLDRKREWIVYR